MTTPTPPRLTGNPKGDIPALGKYMGDIFRALVNEAQLPQVRARLAAILATGIANPAATGTKVIALTPVVLPVFTDPPTAAEMEALRQQMNAVSAALLKVLQASQLQ